jgi:hypothetical protein
VAQVKELRQLTTAFKESYPDEPGGPSGPVQSDIPELEDDESSGGGGGSGGGNADCIDNCNDGYDDAAIVAELIYIKENILCVLAASGGGPAAPIIAIGCGAAALTELAITMAIADDHRDDCIDACNGVNPDGECSYDWDCEDSEYCFEGLASLGNNTCRDKRELGQVCSRDGKCESGCCRYDFWVNPFQMTCQPFQECN